MKTFRHYILYIFSYTLALCALNTLCAQSASQTLQLGTRTFAITKTTPDDTPVIPMWKAPMPTRNRAKAAGFPLLKGVEHFDVWKPASEKDGTYSHHPDLIYHDGRFYALWSNGWFEEDSPGQRILYSTSKDGRSWTPAAELFEPPGPIAQRDTENRRVSGIHLVPDRWVVLDGKLYGIVYVFGAGKSYPIARELAADGTRGEAVLVHDLPENTSLPDPKYLRVSRRDPALAAKINQWYKDNDAISWWAICSDEPGVPRVAVDGAVLHESFVFRSKHGLVLGMRDFSNNWSEFGEKFATSKRNSNRIYASFGDGKGGWSVPYPTDIPDSPSRTHALRLPDGRVLLCGNQIAPEFDKSLGHVRDPLTLAVSPDGEFFTKVFAVRSGGSTRPAHRFAELAKKLSGRRPAGFGYPSMVHHDGTVYILYSISKEDIAITLVPLGALGANE